MKYFNFLKVPLILTFLTLFIILGYDFSYKSLSIDDSSLQTQYQHLEIISAETHPVGSEYHAEVANYIESTISSTNNFDLQVQEGKDELTGIDVKNIFAIKKSQGSDDTIMISAHYDSEAGSFGANDDGLAIASMLTIMQMYDEIAIDKNLLLFFSDAEEQNLAGARYFVDNKDEYDFGDIRSIFNFEARGAFGPIYLFESVNSNSTNTADVISQIKIVNNQSITQEIYQSLPNNSDLSVLKELGVPGYNFGYFRGLFAYHTPEDNLKNTSVDTREQQIIIMENIINNWVDSDQGSRETNLVFLSLINRINLQFGGILFLVILAIIHLIYFFKKYRQIKNIKFNLKIPLIVFFSLGVFTIFLDTLLNYLVFLNYIIALVLICLYILTTAVSISFILRDKARGLLEIPLFILGILSIFLFDIFYLIALVLLIFELYSLFVAKLGKLKIFVGLTSIILINLIFIPFVWELVWLYDNRLNTLMILLITSSFISVVNILMVESLIGKADS